jgi:heptosyltransferase II
MRLQLLILLLRYFRSLFCSIQGIETGTIFCIRMSAIGDSVIALQAVNFLQRALPNATVFYVVDKSLIEALNFLAPNVKLVGHETPQFYEALRETADRTCVVFDFQGTSRSRRVVLEILKVIPKLYLKLPKKKTVSRLTAILRARFSISQFPRSTSSRPVSVERLQQMQIQSVLNKTKKIPTDTHQISSQEMNTKPFKVSEPTIVFFLGASGRLKHWPKENWLELSRLIYQNKNWKIKLVGSTEDELVASYIFEKNSCRQIENCVGKLSLKESFELIIRSNFVVTADSFAAHVARHARVPGVVLFGATSPAFGFVPQFEGLKFLFQNLSCSPCSRHGKGECRFQNLVCLKDIFPAEVFKISCEALDL